MNFKLNDNFNQFILRHTIENVIGYQVRNVYCSASDPDVVRDVVVLCNPLAGFHFQNNIINTEQVPFIYCGNMRQAQKGPLVMIKSERLIHINSFSFTLQAYNPDNPQPMPYYTTGEISDIHFYISVEIGLFVKK